MPLPSLRAALLSSVATPAEAKGTSLKSGISISREAKLIRVIRVKLNLKAKRVAEKKALVETGRSNGVGRTRAVDSVEAGNLAATRPRLQAQ